MEENNQKMLLPFTYNHRVCPKTDVLAQGKKKKKMREKRMTLAVPRSCLYGWVVSCFNLYLLYFRFFLALCDETPLKNNERKKMHIEQIKWDLLSMEIKFETGGGTMVGCFLGTAVLGVVFCYVVTSSPACVPTMQEKAEKCKKKVLI